ncbi:type II toxin-antitoxin system VapC family toxin [soil metagenome]
MIAKRARWACDTSVAVAALDPNHEAHRACRAAVVELRPALAGHAAFETFAVLTRLPVPLRLSAAQASAAITGAFPEECWLASAEQAKLRGELAEYGIVGGSVYDALVGRGASAAGRSLLTRDRRAERTYRALEVAYRLVE